jgi:hypothetical protein
VSHYNEKLWAEGDEYCTAVWLAAQLMRKSERFVSVEKFPVLKITNYDDVIVAFSKWLEEENG